MRNVFKKESDRSGVIISETTKGFKVETWSAFEDELNRTYYIKYQDEFQPGFDKWEESINEYGTMYWQLLVEFIRNGGIQPYRVVTA